jgi:hypothetical protein
LKDPRACFPAGLLEAAPLQLDLTDEAQQDRLLEAGEGLLARCREPGSLEALESQLLDEREAWPLVAHVAVKLARSKRLLEEIDEPCHLSLVVALYGEHNRIRPRSEHPHGENFLTRKLAELSWLFDGHPGITWDLLLVDDGCPDRSGEVAREILRAHHPKAPAEVVFLADAIAAGEAGAAPLGSTDESRKGGSVEYGMWRAISSPRAAVVPTTRHVLAFTDADLSTHLGQLGLLLHPIVRGGQRAAIASRRDPRSVVVKAGARNYRGLLFIYLWKRLLPQLAAVVDTQCGFKAFRADLAREILEGCIEKGFAFDIELLLRTELASPGATAVVPVAWIDSEAASTTTELQPYLPMLRSIVQIYRRYVAEQAGDAESQAFAEAIESLDEAGWQRCVERLGTSLSGSDPAGYDSFRPFGADELREAAR